MMIELKMYQKLTNVYFHVHMERDYSGDSGGKKTRLDRQFTPYRHVVGGLFRRAAHRPVDAAFL